MSLRKKLKWLDPFTYVEIALRKVHPKTKKYSAADEAIDWIVYLVSAFIFAWIIYSVIGIAFNTPAPMVIVVSGSMEPVMHRGDVIILQGLPVEQIKVQEIELNLPTLQETGFFKFASGEYEINQYGFKEMTKIKFFDGQEIFLNKEGDVIVYFSALRQEPVIHRAVAKIKVKDGYYFLTKGDSIYNPTIDQDCGTIEGNRIEKACITLYPIKFEELQGKAVFQIPLIGYVKLILIDDLGKILTGKQLDYFP